MEITPELLGTAGVGVIVIVGAIGNYLRNLRASPPTANPVLAGVGLEFGNRAQMDLLIGEIRRIGDILENKRQAGIESKLQHLVEEIDELRAKR